VDEVRYMIAVLVRSPCRGGKYEVTDGVNVKIPAPSVVGACPDNVAAAGRACCCSSGMGQAAGVHARPE